YIFVCIVFWNCLSALLFYCLHLFSVLHCVMCTMVPGVTFVSFTVYSCILAEITIKTTLTLTFELDITFADTFVQRRLYNVKLQKDILGEQGSQQGGRDIFITGTLGVGQVVLLQKLQNLWSKREFKNLEQSSSSMFGAGWFSTFKDTERDLRLRLHVRFRGPSFSRSMDNDENPDGTLIRRVPEVRKLLKGSPFRAGLFGKKGVLSGFLPGTTSKVTWLCIFRTTNQGSSFSSTSVGCSWVTSPRPGLLKEEHRLLSAFAKLPLLGMEKGELHFARRKIGFLRGPVSHYDACGGAAFLTAFSLVFFAKCEYKKSSRFSCRYDPFMTNEHFQFTNLFLCGLLSQSPKAAPSLEHLVPPLDLKKKRRALKSYLSSSVRIHLRGLPRYPSTDIQGSKVHVMPNFLWILRCIFETHSEDVARLTAKGISADYIKLAYCNIYSADCSSLGVDLDNNNISDYGVKQLVPSFSKMDSGKVRKKLDSSIEVLSRELIRYKNRQGSGTAGAKLVAQIIEECPHIMTVKKISPVLYFCEGNCKCNWCFRAGRMWGNSIGDEGAEAFAEALKNHPKLTNLSLSANGISSEGGRSLARALKENSSLHIFCVHVNVCFVFFRLIQNSISDDAASELQEALRRNTAFLICKIKGNSTFLSALYF
uniref:Nucleotide binding oligomerization domain containing 1 n=1 Tax=Astyanax mexicanus TaxID=7994 RepID=A0A3B1ICP1_ASTMX